MRHSHISKIEMHCDTLTHSFALDKINEQKKKTLSHIMETQKHTHTQT